MAINCTEDYLQRVETSKQWYYILVQIIHVLFCIGALPLTYLACNRMFERIPLNLRVLMFFHHIAVCTFCLSFISIETYHIISRFFYTGCDLMVSARVCLCFRIFQSSASVLFQCFHVGAVLNTWLNRFSPTWRNRPGAARLLGWFCVCLAFAATSGSIPVDLNSTEYLINCASLEHKKKSTQRGIFLWFIALDITSITSLLTLKFYEKKQLANPVLKYNVNQKQKINEISRQVAIIVPSLALNACCYLYFSITSILFSTGDSTDPMGFLISFSVPIYVFFAPLLWRRGLSPPTTIGVEKTITTAEKHFIELEKTWNSVMNAAQNTVQEAARNRGSNKQENVFHSIGDDSSNSGQ